MALHPGVAHPPVSAAAIVAEGEVVTSAVVVAMMLLFFNLAHHDDDDNNKHTTFRSAGTLLILGLPANLGHVTHWHSPTTERSADEDEQ